MGFIKESSHHKVGALKFMRETLAERKVHPSGAALESGTDSVTWRTHCRYGEFPCSTGNAITSATS